MSIGRGNASPGLDLLDSVDISKRLMSLKSQREAASISQCLVSRLTKHKNKEPLACFTALVLLSSRWIRPTEVVGIFGASVSGEACIVPVNKLCAQISTGYSLFRKFVVASHISSRLS